MPALRARGPGVILIGDFPRRYQAGVACRARPPHSHPLPKQHGMSTITTSKNSGASSSQACSGASACAEVKPELVRQRAYEIFQARKGAPGNQVSDWTQAEQELSGARQDAPARPGQR